VDTKPSVDPMAMCTIAIPICKANFSICKPSLTGVLPVLLVKDDIFELSSVFVGLRYASRLPAFV
jgi:hypothetical protein